MPGVGCEAGEDRVVILSPARWQGTAVAAMLAIPLLIVILLFAPP